MIVPANSERMMFAQNRSRNKDMFKWTMNPDCWGLGFGTPTAFRIKGPVIRSRLLVQSNSLIPVNYWTSKQ